MCFVTATVHISYLRTCIPLRPSFYLLYEYMCVSSCSCLQAEGKHWHNPKVYLMQVSCKDDILQRRTSKTFATPTSKTEVANAAMSISQSFRETIYLSTLACSTKLTQKSMFIYPKSQFTCAVITSNKEPFEIKDAV